MIDTVSSRGHHGRVRVSPKDLRQAWVGTAKFGNSFSTVRAQLVATARRATTDHVVLRQSGSDLVEHRIDEFVLTGRASDDAARALTDTTHAAAADRTGNVPVQSRISSTVLHAPHGDVELDVLLGDVEEKHAGAPYMGWKQRGNTPRPVALNVHGFRVTINTVTGEVPIFQSVQGATAGKGVSAAVRRRVASPRRSAGCSASRSASTAPAASPPTPSVSTMCPRPRASCAVRGSSQRPMRHWRLGASSRRASLRGAPCSLRWPVPSVSASPPPRSSEKPLARPRILRSKDPQHPITEERQSRVRRENYSREGMEEHKA